jgi:hypothetical protein
MRNDLTPLDTTLVLLARSLWPVPIKRKRKAPIGENWGADRPTEESLRAIYSALPGAGVGIRLGPEAGVIDIEVDDPEGEKSLRKILCGEPLTLGWSSRRGPHYLFRYNPELAKYGKSIIKVPELPGLEIRIGGDGVQLQSVCPPSIGDDGKPRQWNDCDEIAELPPSVFVFLDAYMSQPAEPGPAPPAPPTPAPQVSFPAAAGTTLSVEERAIRYLATVEPAISGQHGSGKTFGAACRVGPGFDLDPEAAFRLLRDHYSPRCVPQWSEKELRHKVVDAYKNESRRGWLKDAPLPGASSGSPSCKRTGRYASDPDDAPIVLPEWPDPPDSAAYHGLGGDIVRAIESRSEADPAALLFQLLIAFGSIVGRRPHVRVGGSFQHANENVLLVGPTGAGRKGQSWAEILVFFEGIDPAWSKCVVTGLSSAEGLIYAVRDPVEGIHHVKEKGRIIDTQTVIVDPGVADKRLLAVESEFGGVLKKAGREGNALTAVLRQAWDGSHLRTLTKGSPYQASGAHISLITHITPEELASLLAEVDIANGFINRFLPCCTRRSKLLPFGGRVPQDEMDHLRARLAEAVAFARAVEDVRWASDAMDLWRVAYPRLTTRPPGALGKATSRAEAHSIRLGLHYALLDQSARIEPEHLEAALAAWDYAERSARYIFGDSTGDRDADRILAALRATPTGLDRHEIRRDCFGDHRPADWVASKLSLLLRVGAVRRGMIPTAGRSAERWFAVGGGPRVGVESVISPPSDVISPPSHAYHAPRAAENMAAKPPSLGNGVVSPGPADPADSLGLIGSIFEPEKPFYVDAAGVASKDRPDSGHPSGDGSIPPLSTAGEQPTVIDWRSPDPHSF